MRARPPVLPAFQLLSFWLLLCACVHAQEIRPAASPEYMRREWRDADGLPSDEAGSLMIDDDGYLWIATSNALARFDGKSFELEKIPTEVSARGMIYGKLGPGATRGTFIALVNSSPNVEVSGGESAGWYRYGPEGFEWVDEPLLAGRAVRVAFFGPDGALWLGSEDGALLRCLGDERKLFEPPPGLTGKKLPSFAIDGDQQLWVAIASYVARYENGSWVTVSVDKKDPPLRLGSSQRGGPWLFTRTTVLKWNEGYFEEHTKLPELLGAHFIHVSTEDVEGHLWIGTRSQGLFRLQDRSLHHVPTSNDEIFTLVHDRDGNLWAATNGGGINRLRRRAHRLIDQRSGLTDNFSYTIAEDEQGVVWLANRDGGVARVSEGKVDPISRRANWRSFSAMSVYPATAGGVWISTGIGIFRTDPKNPEVVRRAPGLSGVRLVRVSYVSRNGDYWISLDPDRVGYWGDGALTVFGPDSGFEGREVRAITEDAQGTVWIASGDGGLHRGGRNGFERLPMPEGLQPGALQSVWFDDDGTMLVGTSRSGVLIYPPGATTPARILKNTHGLPSNNITNMLADDRGRCWFASRGGIFWIDRDQLNDFIKGASERVHTVLLGQDDGVPDLSCQGLYQPSAWKARDGTLWFATRSGVLNTDPSLVSVGAELPPATIVSIHGDGRALPVSPRISIGSHMRKLEIRFSVLNLTAPDRTMIRHRLEGFDDDWVVVRNGGAAVYPRLSPGRYTLHVMASDGSGVWNEQPPLLTLIVVAPWWQSQWAWAGYFVLTVALVFVCVRAWSHRRLRMRLERLEHEQAIERERTRIARDIHDDLGASLTRINLLSQSAPRDGPAQAVLDQIYEAASAVTHAMDEIVWAVNPKFDDLEGLVYYIINYTQKYLSPTGIRLRLDVPEVLPSLPLTSQVRHHLFLCCKEALNNVVKHAHAESVTLSVAIKGNVLNMTLTDHPAADGVRTSTGLSADRIASGNGLANMHRRMEEVGGYCEVTKPSEGGTRVRFVVPLASRAR